LPIPTQLLFTFASGVLMALVARAELRGSPSAASATPAFLAYLTYVGLVLLPGSLYLYLHYGDWYLLYAVDTDRVPSALVLLGALLQCALGAGGFLLGATCIRKQREPWAGAVAGVALCLALVALALARERLAVVGTQLQFRGDFGLLPFGGAIMLVVACITLFALVGLGVAAHHVSSAQRRS
jgi:hypothetical protein